MPFTIPAPWWKPTEYGISYEWINISNCVVLGLNYPDAGYYADSSDAVIDGLPAAWHAELRIYGIKHEAFLLWNDTVSNLKDNIIITQSYDGTPPGTAFYSVEWTGGSERGEDFPPFNIVFNTTYRGILIIDMVDPGHLYPHMSLSVSE